LMRALNDPDAILLQRSVVGGLLVAAGLNSWGGLVIVLGLALALAGVLLAAFENAETIRSTPSERIAPKPDLHAIYGHLKLKSLDVVYKEAKYTYDDQRQRIDAITTRATWVVATSAGVVAIVGSQFKNIADLKPDIVSIVGFAIGITLAVYSALLGIRTAWRYEYQGGLSIERLLDDYTLEEPRYSKLQWLGLFRDAYAENENVLAARGIQLDRGMTVLTASFGVIVLSSIYLLAQGVRQMPCWPTTYCLPSLW
jgi:hypothetical protein